MPGKARPCLRKKTLENVRMSNLCSTDKKCIEEIFNRYEQIESLCEYKNIETVDETIKALECCTYKAVPVQCPRHKFSEVCDDYCIQRLMEQTLEVITNQKNRNKTITRRTCKENDKQVVV